MTGWHRLSNKSINWQILQGQNNFYFRDKRHLDTFLKFVPILTSSNMLHQPKPQNS